MRHRPIEAPAHSGVSGRRLLSRLRDIMAGSGTAQERLDKIVSLIAAEMVAEVCSCYLMRAGEVLELFATVGLNPEAVHQTRLAETMSSGSPAWIDAVNKLQAAGMSHLQAVGAVTQQVINQAYLLAALDFFRVSAWLCVILIPLIWLARKAMSGGGVHAAAD